MTFAIRRADPADFERAGALTVQAYIEDGHIPAGSEYAHTLADAAARAADAELWVAVDDTTGTVLGSVTFAAPGSPYLEVAGPREGEFRMLAVAHEARGLGVGATLVQQVIGRARELGLTGLAMSTQPTMLPAHWIYQRLGFERTPERDWSPVPGVELLTYRLAL